MTNQELNRDIKRLAKGIAKAESTGSHSKYFDYIETLARPEYLRLYHADKEFKVMTKANILTMLRLNIRYRFVALHTFGIHIDL